VESFQSVLDLIINSLLIPVIVIVIPIILMKAQGYAKRITTSTTEKNEKESLESVVSVTSQLLEQVEMIVSAAIASNMDLANEMKEAASDGKLTDEEIESLHASGKSLVYRMLPGNLTKGALLTLLGGREHLDAMIDSFMKLELIKLKAEMSRFNDTVKSITDSDDDD